MYTQDQGAKGTAQQGGQKTRSQAGRPSTLSTCQGWAQHILFLHKSGKRVPKSITWV